MSGRYGEPTVEAVSQWWATGITQMSPGSVRHRGTAVQDIVAERDFVSAIWFMVRGDWPTPERARLLTAALVGSMDHGPQAPSIAIARMAITCGVDINNAMASGINVLGDSHGGAAQQCVELLDDVVTSAGQGPVEDVLDPVLERWRARSKYLPGFGHRFHPLDPRREPLLRLVGEAVDAGAVAGKHLRAALAIEAALATGRARPVPMNVDGATAIVYAELGFPPELARGLFILSRSVGVLANAWEERQSGRRNKGPVPPSILPAYTGGPSAE